MKLWVSFFVAAVWALQLPSDGYAKSLRQVSNKHEDTKLKFVSKFTSKRADPKEVAEKKNVIIASLFTLRKKFPTDDINEFKQTADDIVDSLTSEELQSDKLQGIIISKYNNNSKFTVKDEKFYEIMMHLFSNPELPGILERVTKKDYPGVGGPDKAKIVSNALFDVIAGMSKTDLMKPTFSEILEERMDEFFADQVENTSIELNGLNE